ncbi:MAG TPA: phosphoribosylglycinamide formyltransferase [Usitatibacter sp.]|nr:phosphoribosylglycinamide formyltransferase [Usitatibacter sp.]
MKSAVILISGRGSNMRSLVDGRTGLDIRAVISNRPEAGGLEWARGRGIPTAVVDHQRFPGRESFDAALADAVGDAEVVLLAGFMRILTPGFIRRFERRMLNIHPSLLPSFPGLHTHRRALEAGVKVHGCTVHFVTPELDNGPIVIQAAVPVLAGDTEDALAARVLEAEHRIYPQAARWLAQGRLELSPTGGVHVRDAAPGTGCLLSPPEER